MAVNVILHMCIYEKQQVGDLVVVGCTLAYGRNDNEAAVRVGRDNLFYFAELIGGRN